MQTMATVPPSDRCRRYKDPARRRQQPTAANCMLALTWAKGQIGARWLAEDDNGDTLQFKIEIRGVNETAWKLIRDKVREHYG